MEAITQVAVSAVSLALGWVAARAGLSAMLDLVFGKRP